MNRTIIHYTLYYRGMYDGGVCNTKCPFNIKHEDNTPVMVGSRACNSCEYFEEENEAKHIVICNCDKEYKI